MRAIAGSARTNDTDRRLHLLLKIDTGATESGFVTSVGP